MRSAIYFETPSSLFQVSFKSLSCLFQVSFMSLSERDLKESFDVPEVIEKKACKSSVYDIYNSSADDSPFFLRASSNLAFMVGLLRVSFLIVSPSSLSLAKRKRFSLPNNASLIFCKC